MQRFASIILKYRVVIIISTILITLGLGINLKDIKINSDVTTYLPESDEAVMLFKYIGQEYGTSWTAIVIVESDETFSKRTIENIYKITDTLRYVDGIEYVSSLTNILDIKTSEDGFEISRLIDEYALPQTEQELKHLKEYTLSKDIYKGQLISNDGRFSLILCQISAEHDKNKMAKEIKNIVKSFNFPEKFYFEGMPFQVQSIMQFVIDDLIVLTPLIVVIILLTLYLSFRTFRSVLLPILAVGMGIIWTLSLMALFGIKLSPLSDALPVVLFAVGSAYGIHVVNKIKIHVTSSENKIEQLTKALSEIGLAVILAGLTTFVGFLSFIFNSYLTIVREFGIFAALGVAFTLFISITFIPAVISYLPVEKPKTINNKIHFNFIDIFLKWLSDAVIKYRKAIFYFTLILLAVSFIGMPFIQRKVDILEYFKPKSDIRISSKIMNTEFGGSLPVQIVVRGDILSPDVLKKMDNITQFLKSLEGVSNVRSVADFVKQMNDAMGEGDKIPNSREKIANLWFMLEGDEIITQMLNYSKDEAVIYATMKNLEAKKMHHVNDTINQYLNSLNTSELSFKATGLQAIYINLDNSMMKNLIQSMVLAFVFIFITMFFLLRSAKGALTGMITLFFSVALIFGFMGFTGIALDIATILIASVTVGIGIDYSIHFVSSYRMYLSQNCTINEAIQNTIISTGKAIVINVITIIMGFLVLLFANLIPLQQLGILIALTMFCSGFGSITLMPAIISMFKIKIIKK